MVPFNKREYDLFLSYAHTESILADKLYNWLTKKAGFSIWYDPNFAAGSYLGDLKEGLKKCRGLLLLNSPTAFDPKHGWIKKEYEIAHDLHSNDPNYKIIVVNTLNAKKDDLYAVTWIDMSSEELDLKLGLDILNAFYGNKHIIPGSAKDIYISCSWKPEDFTSAKTVCTYLIGQGYRLIGDSKDQKGFDPKNRIEKIIKSCGAFVCIIPFRNETKADISEGPYKYFLKEIELARNNNIPCYVIADPRVEMPDWSKSNFHLLDTNTDSLSELMKTALDNLDHDWEKPNHPQYIFYSLDFNAEFALKGSSVRSLMEKITALPITTGWEVDTPPIQVSIIETIKNSFVTLADISQRSENEPLTHRQINVNSCIEAAVAIAANVNLEILQKKCDEKTPFMLKSYQIDYYETDFEMAGLVHEKLRPYRRRVINNEL